MDLLYLSRADVERVALPLHEIVDALEVAFREKGEGRVEVPPKPGIHPANDAFIHAMLAHVPALGAAGMKWVSGYPSNQERGLPYVNGLLILNDPASGVPISVMDCTWITAKRTAAATVVAARRLARPESATLGILACGVQGRSHLEALSAEFELEHVRVYDIRAEVARALASEMGAELGLEIEVVGSAREAVEGLELVVTSGPILKNPTPLIEAGWLPPGSFASAVDFDSYFQGAALREADLLVTDDMDQMEYYRSEGYFQDTPRASADLGELVTGKKPGRTNADQRTVSMNLGLAIDDMATAIRIYERASQQGIGTTLEL